MVKIATWNVNSVKARLPRVLEWLDEFQPDVALLQETKTVDETFPALEIGDLGYNIQVSGQKTYNGVAILSKAPIEIELTALPGDKEDDQARYIEALVTGKKGSVVRVASIAEQLIRNAVGDHVPIHFIRRPRAPPGCHTNINAGSRQDLPDGRDSSVCRGNRLLSSVGTGNNEAQNTVSIRLNSSGQRRPDNG